jgi:hypothetical protein
MSTVVDLSLDALEAMLVGEVACEVQHVESRCTGNVVGILNDRVREGHTENGKKCCSGVVEWREQSLMANPHLLCGSCVEVGIPNNPALICWRVVPI